MPDRYYRGERDRAYGSEDRGHANSRRGDSASERTNHHARDRGRRDGTDRYRDDRRAYDRHDEVRNHNYRHDSYRRHADRSHHDQHEQTFPDGNDDRQSRGAARHTGQIEATGSSEMRERRRREHRDQRESHDVTGNDLKRERSEESESEPAKRRRSDGDAARPVHSGRGSDLESDILSRIGVRQDSHRRTNRSYDQFRHDDPEGNTASQRRYSQDVEVEQTDYDHRRDRVYGRRSRQDFERGEDEQQAERPSKRRLSDQSPAQGERTGHRRSAGSPHQAETEGTSNARAESYVDRRRRFESNGAPLDNQGRRENFPQGNNVNETDPEMVKYNEMRNSRATRFRRDEPPRGFGDRERGAHARDNPRSGFRAGHRDNQQPDENRHGFGVREHGAQGRGEPRRGFGLHERENHRFRGGRPQESGQFEMRQFNRFDNTRPGRGRRFGGPGRGGFQQTNAYDPSIRTLVERVPVDENIVHDEMIFRFGSLIHTEEAWGERDPNDEIPEIYKTLEEEMRAKGVLKGPSGMDTQSKSAKKDSNYNVNTDTQGSKGNSRCNASTGTINDVKVSDESNGNTKLISNSNMRTEAKGTEERERVENGRERSEVRMEESQNGRQSENKDEEEESRKKNVRPSSNGSKVKQESVEKQDDANTDKEGRRAANKRLNEAEERSEANTDRDKVKDDDNEKEERIAKSGSTETSATTLPRNQPNGSDAEEGEQEEKAADEELDDKGCSPVNVIVQKKGKE